jgi:acetyl esterase/lipase
VERMDAYPSFQILVYPGPLGIPEAVVGPTAPPAFLVAANDDACCAAPIVTLLQKYRDAHASVEIHLYAKGDHAFNMGKRSPLLSIQNWTKRLEEWLRDFGYLGLKPKA